jgi:hypothetical protein
MANHVGRTIWTEGESSPPVSPDNPLVGLETRVLRMWLDQSPTLARLYRKSPQHQNDLENAVRLKVDQTLAEELQLRAQGLSAPDARELTRPSMWIPPTWPTTPPSPAPSPAAPLPDATPSPTAPN